MTALGTREHWSEPGSYSDDWLSRSAQAARLIRLGAVVLDIGCGPRMGLRGYLPEGCAYIPADLVRWTPDVQFIDVDANLFPDLRFDTTVMLGVVEYLRFPELAFQFCRGRAASMIVSYCHPKTPDPARRIEAGWVNAFSQEELSAVAAKGAWRLCGSETYRTSDAVVQRIHTFEPNAS